MGKLSSYTPLSTIPVSYFVPLFDSGVQNYCCTYPNFASGILPSQTSQSGKFLATNGTILSWATPSGSASSYVALSGTESISGVKTFASSPVFNTIGSTQVHYGQTLTGSNNLRFDGTTLSGTTLILTNALGLSYGGTASTSASGAINTIVPSQATNSGFALVTNGGAVSWSGILPSQTSQSGKILATNGSGALWVVSGAGGGSTSPGGSTSNIQYANAGSFAGDANLTWNGTYLSIGNLTNSGVMFASGSGLKTSSSFIWDNANSRLGVGTSPGAILHIKGGFGSDGQVLIQDPSNTGNNSYHLIGFTDSVGSRQAYFYKSPGGTPAINFGIDVDGLIGYVINGSAKLDLSASTSRFYNNVEPFDTNTYKLGSTSKYWSSGYIDNLIVNTLTLNSGASNSPAYWYPQTFSWGLPSNLISGVGTNVSYELVIPMNCILQSGGYSYIRSKVAPSGDASGLVVDINYDGTSIWNSAQGNRLRMLSTVRSGEQNSFSYSGILQKGHYLSLDIDVCPSGVYAQDIIVELLTMAQK